MGSNPYETPRAAEKPSQHLPGAVELLAWALELVTVTVVCAVAGYLLGQDYDSSFWAAYGVAGIYIAARVGWIVFRRREPMRYRLRTLLIGLAVAPVVLTALLWWANLFLEAMEIYYFSS
jgi:hypothetical protein